MNRINKTRTVYISYTVVLLYFNQFRNQFVSMNLAVIIFVNCTLILSLDAGIGLKDDCRCAKLDDRAKISN